MPAAVAASANCALSQVLYGLEAIGVMSGHNVVIQGAGGLGLNAIAVAKDKGAVVVVVDGVPARLELAKAFGADHVVDLGAHPAPNDRAARGMGIYDGYGAPD